MCDKMETNNGFYLERPRYFTSVDEWGEIEYHTVDGNPYLLDICDIRGHEFVGEIPQDNDKDISLKCMICDDMIRFKYYPKPNMINEIIPNGAL